MVKRLEPGGAAMYLEPPNHLSTIGGGSPPGGGEGPPMTGSPGPGGGKPPVPPPVKVERFTDVLCPRRVGIDTDRFAVVVGLTIRAESGDAKRVAVETGKPVSVELTSLMVEPVGKASGTLTVEKADHEPRVTFIYRPREVGRGHIRVDYSQDGHSLASVFVPVEVVDREVAENPSRWTTPMQEVGDAKPADWQFYVEYDPRPQTRLLKFAVAQGDGPRMPLGESAARAAGKPVTL